MNRSEMLREDYRILEDKLSQIDDDIYDTNRELNELRSTITLLEKYRGDVEADLENTNLELILLEE